ncbi:MAG: multidrug effflux MFS transporter [Actinobacteria bacterium]|nr:multidrug effflux MFS transporter [Actinomycetota bacterium]
MTTTPLPAAAVRRPWRLIVVLGILEAFGPLSMDVYMPQLPHLAASLHTSDALAQATMSACMIGLGLGQLVAGPLSDRFGRRLPLLVGVIAFTLLSVACAFAPNIQVLIIARALQGLAGSAGMVISLAVARDMFTGVELSRMLSLLMLVSGAAPIVAPLIGGQLAIFMDWRGVFGVLAATGLALTALVVFGLPETLPVARRHGGGVAELGRHLAAVLRDRLFMAVFAAGLISGVAFFAYLSMSSFVLEGEFGFSPQLFSLFFAANAVANIAGGQISRLLVRRMGPLRMYLAGVLATAAAAIVLIVSVLVGAGVFGVLLSLCGFLFAVGLGGPNGSTLALSHHGARAGTASAFLGSGSLLLGPILVPLVSLLGVTSLTMAVTIAASCVAAAVVGWFLVRPAAQRG